MPRVKLTEERKKELADIKKKRLTAEAIENELKDIRRCFINEPTINRKVGDRVRRGNIEKSTITEILDSGKIYKLHEVYVENNYGRPFTSERDAYVAWHDVSTYYEKQSNIPVFHKKDDIQIDYMQTSICHIYSIYYSFGLNLEPDYQRGYVWTPDDKIKLIDSIFNNIDIGKFVFIHLDNYSLPKLYEILDGKQRVSTIIDFYEGRFKYKGYWYRDMCNHDRYHFDMYHISVGNAKRMTKKQIYEYFLKLNTTGRPIDPEHINRVKKLYEESE